ncbi:TetR/AcrR family transcriptional regulator [Microbacterium sp. ZW T2_14]|uniref:TetR/AcrR family transcriptional regulator n=1 Tax=Microbacterium sp. ZW T2_14 TaxID=3378079 RepID=UPI003854D6B5
MSRPPLAREKVLDAFEQILIEEGERAATMDATAKAAGVSKGGLLYHFGTKEALESAIIDRLRMLVADDVATMAAAPEGPIAYFLRTSVMANDPIDRAILATSRLAQGGDAVASDALRDVREQWAAALRPHTKDAVALDLVMLVSDGLYFNNALAGGSIPGPVPRGPALDALIALVERATRG